MTTFTFHPQTVVTMVGPSHSGKSTYARSIKDYVESFGKTCTILSSDELRKEFLRLGSQDSIPDHDGFVVSDLVFQKLFTELKYQTSSPVNTDVVIVDTTGLNTKFRQEVCQLAKDQAYSNIAIVFELSKETIFSRLTENTNTAYIERQINTLRTKVLGKFNKHDYIQTFRITDKTKDIVFDYVDNSKSLKVSEGKAIFYGDVHQCYEEFQNLFLRMKDAHPGARHFLIGDWIDKGDEDSLKVMINIAYNYSKLGNKLPDVQLEFLNGNHEEYVYRHLMDPNYVFEENEETQYFTSLRYLMDPVNAEYRQRFIDLYQIANNFVELHSEQVWAYASHSPCESKYLGKRSPLAEKMMRNTRMFREDTAGKPALYNMEHILNERLTVKHIFGHVEVGKNFHKYNGHIAIDQGCVSGGHLTACLVDLDNGGFFFEYEPSKKESFEEILDFGLHIKPWTSIRELDRGELKTVRRLAKAGAMFVASTAPPTPSFFNEGGVPVLESPEACFNYFVKQGVTDLIVQKKYMGSRCQVYLYPNLEDCKAISRNGFKIKDTIVSNIIKLLHEAYQGSYKELLILDGELLPWTALGRGLVDHDFLPYYEAISTELDAIASSSIKTVLPDFHIEQELHNIQAFKQQLDIYGTDGEPHYAPFGILYCDGEEYLTKPLDESLARFNIPFTMINIETEEGKKHLQSFYDNQVSDGITEGIAVKPNVWKQGLPPMMKVRNEEYLRLVYGYNYTEYLAKHTREKDIRGKLHLSIREQELNLHLIKAHQQNNLKDIDDIYKLLVVEFSKEASLDPRL